MADIEIRRAHGMAKAAARTAADEMAQRLARKFGLKGDWDGDVLRFQGTGVNGTLDVGAKDISLSVALGFMLKAMKGSIEQAINHELEAMFAASPAPTAKKKAAPPRKKDR
ncbi:MAG TPA: polyhydroxyalkanoic acid system family protein [Usitatibacter sp.]|nr:polyhydroxyalkanoic acid system family protein [Usitatibacter sp.]